MASACFVACFELINQMKNYFLYCFPQSIFLQRKIVLSQYLLSFWCNSFWCNTCLISKPPAKFLTSCWVSHLRIFWTRKQFLMTLVKFFLKIPVYGKTFNHRTMFHSERKIISQQNFLFQRQIVLINYFSILVDFQETSIYKCGSKFKTNTLVTEGKKWFIN